MKDEQSNATGQAMDASHAAASLPVRLYQPSNGTEGECFFSAWCCKCDRDAVMGHGKDFDDCGDDELCKIIADSMAYKVSDPEYPREWCYGADGYPQCTAFVPLGTLASLRVSSVAERDDRTGDMFSEPPRP